MKSKARRDLILQGDGELYRYLRYLEGTPVISIADVQLEARVLRATVLRRRRPYPCDYMDSGMREFCSCLAYDLTCIMGRQVYFDIRRGVLRIYL